MAQVRLTINGRVYRMGCDEGQEPALIALAEEIDRRIEGYKAHFGEVGDMRLLIMVALELGDELQETRRRVDALEAEMTALHHEQAGAQQHLAATQFATADMLEGAAGRIERLAAALKHDGAD